MGGVLRKHSFQAALALFLTFIMFASPVYAADRSKTLHALWKPIDYTITYNLNGGSGVSNRTYTVETDTFTLPTPSRTDYTFLGWTGSNGSTPQTSVCIPKGSHENLAYTANWQPTGASVEVQVDWYCYDYIKIGSITYTQSNFGGERKTISIPGGTEIVAQGSLGSKNWVCYDNGAGCFSIGSVARCTVPSGASGEGYYLSFGGNSGAYHIYRIGACTSWPFSVDASVTVQVDWNQFSSIVIGSTTYTQSDFGGNQKTISIFGGTTIVVRGSRGSKKWFRDGDSYFIFGSGSAASCEVPSDASGEGSLYFHYKDYTGYDNGYGDYDIRRGGACESWWFSPY